MRKKEKEYLIRVPKEFKAFVYSEKAKNPDNTINDILKNIAKEGKKDKNDKIFPKW